MNPAAKKNKHFCDNAIKKAAMEPYTQSLTSFQLQRKEYVPRRAYSILTLSINNTELDLPEKSKDY